MPSFSSTYLIPVLFFNPCVILHLINTSISHLVPPPLTPSHSPHSFMESLGPLPGSVPYIDVHADNELCWKYTAVIVIVQLLAFQKVSIRRDKIKAAKAEAARLEKERIKLNKLERLEAEANVSIFRLNGHKDRMDGACDFPEACPSKVANGNGNAKHKILNGFAGNSVPESEGSTIGAETSEEEMIL